MDTQLIRMSAEEAVTLTKLIESNTKALVDEHSEQVIKLPVIEAVRQLSKAMGPLSELPTITYETKREVDIAADGALAGIHSILQGVVQTYEQSAIGLTATEQGKFDAAQLLLQSVFPEGTGFLRETWYQQFGATELILNRISSKELQSAIQDVGLGTAFGFLKRIHKEYGERMGFSKAVDSETNSPLSQWYESLEYFLAVVTVNHKKGSDLRAELHQPYTSLVETIREQRRKARQAAEAKRELEKSSTDEAGEED